MQQGECRVQDIAYLLTVLAHLYATVFKAYLLVKPAPPVVHAGFELFVALVARVRPGWWIVVLSDRAAGAYATLMLCLILENDFVSTIFPATLIAL